MFCCCRRRRRRWEFLLNPCGVPAPLAHQLHLDGGGGKATPEATASATGFPCPISERGHLRGRLRAAAGRGEVEALGREERKTNIPFYNLKDRFEPPWLNDEKIVRVASGRSTQSDSDLNRRRRGEVANHVTPQRCHKRKRYGTYEIAQSQGKPPTWIDQCPAFGMRNMKVESPIDTSFGQRQRQQQQQQQ